MDEVAIVGVGVYPFGKHLDKKYGEITADACKRALEDANMDGKEIQAAWYGTSAGVGAGYLALGEIGASGIPLTRVENACSGGSCALRDAYFAIRAGACDIALAMGVEKMYGSTMGKVMGIDTMAEIESGGVSKEEEEGVKAKGKAGIKGMGGITMPGAFAMIAQAHMANFGTTHEQIAEQSVKSHKNAVNNPYAQYRKAVTLEEVLNSKMISDPLTIYECSPFSDGAAAAILTSGKIAEKYTDTPVYVAASAQASGVSTDPDYATSMLVDATFIPTLRCVKTVEKQANIKIKKDVDVFEVHDCFSIAEIVHYEDLGLCKKGEGGKLLDEGMTEIDGKYPVGPSGGLISVGHPLGATGVRQAADTVWQLKGEAGKNQVEGAEMGLTHTMGWPGQGVVEVINIFRR